MTGQATPAADAGPRFVTRIGLAIVAPRRALAVAGDRRHAGRSGSDLIAMIAILLVATQLRGLVSAIWFVEEDAGLMVRTLVAVLTRSLVVDLAFLVLGALLVWALAGRHRNLGRAFDLACVAALPMLFVDITATFAIRALDAHVPYALRVALSVAAWAWTGALLALAVQPARGAAGKTPPVPGELVQRAKRAGLGVVALAAAGTAIQVGWIALHPDDVRPVMGGAPAPAFALPAIVDGDGGLGPVRELAASRGKITVVDFWASWCHPCLQSLPKLAALAKTPGVDVIAVDLAQKDDPGAAFAVFAEHGYTMPLLADDGITSARYDVFEIPHTVVIDRDGTVHRVVRGTGMDIAAIVDQIRK